MSDNTEFDIDNALVELIELAMCGNQASAIDLANKIEEAHKHALEHCNQDEQVGVVCFDAIGDQQVTAIKWLGEYTPKQGDKIFAHAMPKSEDCVKCKGSGEIGGQVSYGMNEYGYETVNCPYCNGTGEATPQPSTDVSELEKDAARYRYLMENCLSSDKDGYLQIELEVARESSYHWDKRQYWIGEDIDAAIIAKHTVK